MKNLSLLYPPGRETVSALPLGNTANELGLTSLGLEWERYFTDDEQTIEYREQLFSDFLACPALSELFEYLTEQLSAVDELRKIPDSASDNESQLYAIKEVELYIDLITNAYTRLNEFSDSLSSRAVLSLYGYLKDVYQSEEFTALKNGVGQLEFSVKNIRSLTVGINLDASLFPYEAGIVSINDEYFRSGDILSRFMRMDSSNEMTTLVPLSAVSKAMSKKERQVSNIAFGGTIAKIVGGNFRSWRKMLNTYFSLGTMHFVELLPELKFINRATKMLEAIRTAGLPLCTPQVCPKEEKRFDAKGLYNPVNAVDLKSLDADCRIVLNDITFDENGKLYVLTGPNQGGKSIFVKAVGIAQLMFGLGLPIAATSISISPADRIFTQFPISSGSSVDLSRFGEECARLQKMMTYITPYSLVLMDEILSSTDSSEAQVIGQEILTALAIIGCRGILATHLHGLSQKVPEINSYGNTVSKTDNLVMGIDSGKRTYLLYRRPPDGKSYARDISEKYGLSIENILSINNSYNSSKA